MWYSHEEPAPYRLLNVQPTYDLTMISIFAVALYSFRHFISRYFFAPIATAAKLDKKHHERYVENGWYSAWYIIASAAGLALLWNAPFFADYRTIYENYPQKGIPGIRLYHLLALGFYTQAIISMLFIDERTKDFAQMMAHHIITVLLLCFSLLSYFWFFGCVILLLHDVVDIPLYVAKAAHALKWNVTANVSFFLFALSFLLLRLIYFPFIAYLSFTQPPHMYPSITFLMRYVPDVHPIVDISSYGLCVAKHCVSTAWVQNLLLIGLLSLHVFWYALVIKMIINQFKKGGDVEGDPRYMDKHPEHHAEHEKHE